MLNVFLSCKLPCRVPRLEQQYAIHASRIHLLFTPSNLDEFSGVSFYMMTSIILKCQLYVF